MTNLPQNAPSPTPETMEKQLEAISKHADKNERLSWIRKKKKLEELVDLLIPFEERIFAIILEKQPIVDEIAELRSEMVKVCIHPKTTLAHFDTYVLCKFCDRKLSLPVVTEDDEA